MASNRPSVTAIKNWHTRFESELVKVEDGDTPFGGIERFEVWKVTPAGGKPKYYFGESAWSNATREASDFDFNAWGC